jgi:hypothetical protein
VEHPLLDLEELVAGGILEEEGVAYSQRLAVDLETRLQRRIAQVLISRADSATKRSLESRRRSRSRSARNIERF